MLHAQRQADEAGQCVLLLLHVAELRTQTLLLGLEFDQAAIGVYGRLVPGICLRLRLLVADLGVLDLYPLLFDQRDRCHQLQIGSGDGEHHFFSGLARIED